MLNNVKHLAMSIAKSQREILPTLRFVRMTPSQEKVNLDNCYIISNFYLFPCKKRAKAMRCAEFVSFLKKSAIFKLKYHIFAPNVLIYEKSTYFIGDGIDIVFAVMWKH